MASCNRVEVSSGLRCPSSTVSPDWATPPIGSPLIQGREERAQMFLVILPPSDGAVIQRLAYLPMADRCNGPFSSMEIEAGRLPVQVQKLDQPPALAFWISNQRLIVYLD